MDRLRRFSPISFALLTLAASACSGGGGQPPGPIPTTQPSAPATGVPTPGATATAAPGPSGTASAMPTGGPSATAAPTTPGATGSPVPSASPRPTQAPTASPMPTTAPSAMPFTADDWPVFGHDSARSGTSGEVTSTHGALSLNVLWQTKLGDVADSAPIVRGSMLYVTTHAGTTYGIATSNGAKVWTFTTSGPKITTSEPAYDVASNALYAGGVDGKIHRLDPATGSEIASNGFPATITVATQTEKDASPLNVANGNVYAQVSGYDGDATPYVGHVAVIGESTGAVKVFNSLCASQTVVIVPTTCPENRSGMWSRAGVVVDPDASMSGRLFAATGNGTYDPTKGDYGDSAVELASDGSFITNFTPSNFAALDSQDQDLGSTSPAVLPRQSGSSTPLMAVQGGKDGILRLLDRTNLSPSGATLQMVQLGAGLYSAPAVSQSSGGQTFVYVGLPSALKAYTLTTSGGKSQLVSAWTASVSLGGEGTSPAVRDGVVYVAATNALVAFDAATGTMLASSSSLGGVHWESPIIAHGIVYCTDQNDNITAFQIVRTASGSSTTRTRFDARR